MKIFDTNIEWLYNSFLIVRLRNKFMQTLLNSLTKPLSIMYNIFKINRNGNIYRLSITPQVCYLEKMLNDRYDSVLRRIFITDGILRTQKYIYTKDEQRDLYIYTSNEVSKNFIYTSAEDGYYDGSFIVNVSAGISFNEPEMRSLIDTYKLAGRSFKIKIY